MQCLQHCHLYVSIYYLDMFSKKDSTIKYKPDPNIDQENMNQKQRKKPAAVFCHFRELLQEK